MLPRQWYLTGGAEEPCQRVVSGFAKARLNPCPNERQWLGHARRPNNGGLARLGILHETTPNHTALCALSKWQVKRAFGTGS